MLGCNRLGYIKSMRNWDFQGYGSPSHLPVSLHLCNAICIQRYLDLQIYITTEWTMHLGLWLAVRWDQADIKSIHDQWLKPETSEAGAEKRCVVLPSLQSYPSNCPLDAVRRDRSHPNKLCAIRPPNWVLKSKKLKRKKMRWVVYLAS